MTTTPSPEALAIDGNDIWEALFSIMKGNVPDEMTEEVCAELASDFNRRVELEGKIAASQAFAAVNTRSPTPTDSGEVVQGDDWLIHELARGIETLGPLASDSREYDERRYWAGYLVAYEGLLKKAQERDHRLAFSRPEPVGDEALVERVARAICFANCLRATRNIEYSKVQSAAGWDLWQDEARAAIQAIPATATDAGQSADSLVEALRILNFFRAPKSETWDYQESGFAAGWLQCEELWRAEISRVRASLPKSPSAGEEA